MVPMLLKPLNGELTIIIMPELIVRVSPALTVKLGTPQVLVPPFHRPLKDTHDELLEMTVVVACASENANNEIKTAKIER